jgi:Secretion system C-terminal sorting domain/Fibronectin type III domain/Cleaved Adhesin Domain
MKKITLLMTVLMWSSMFYAQTYLSEGFESGVPPTTGWVDLAGTGDVNGYTWAASSSRANSGTNSAWFDDNFIGETTSVRKNRYLITPVMDLSGATSPELTYYENTRFPGFPALNGVYYSTDFAGDPNTATWIPINTTFGADAVDVWKIRGPYALPVNVTVYVAFRYDGTNNSEWFVDDVLVRETPTCVEPSAGSFTNVTSTTATFSWTSGPGGTETLWDVELVDITAGGTPTGTPTQSGVTNPYTFTSLTPQNQYEVYVRADCGGSTSAWSGPFAFITINDDCISAFTVTHETSIPNAASATATNGSIVGATGSGLIADTCSGGASDTEDVWFSFVAVEQTANVTIEAGSFDVILMVYSGSCGSPVNIGCADNGVENQGEELNLTGLTVGDTYYIRVFEYYATPPASSVFTVKVWTSDVLSNNEFDIDNAFRYYPNPVNNELNLKAQNNIENVSIYNMLGQEVLRLAPNTNSSKIDMSALQTGAYFIRVTINGVTETKQIIKR